MQRALVLGFCGLAACAPPSLKARLANAERRVLQSERAFLEAERHMREGALSDADDPLEEAGAALKDPDVDYHPERVMLRERYDRLSTTLAQLKVEKAKRELAEAVDRQKAAIEDAQRKLADSTKANLAPAASSKEVDALDDAVDKLKDLIDDGVELERQDVRYERFALAARKALPDANAQLELGRQRLRFVEGPLARQLEADERAKRAKAEKDLQQRKELVEDARDDFKRCAEEAQTLLTSTERLRTSKVQSANKVTTPAAVLKRCVEQKAAHEKLLASIDKQLAQREKQAARAKARPPTKKKRGKK